jgi:hypothetical protein
MLLTYSTFRNSAYDALFLFRETLGGYDKNLCHIVSFRNHSFLAASDGFTLAMWNISQGVAEFTVGFEGSVVHRLLSSGPEDNHLFAVSLTNKVNPIV